VPEAIAPIQTLIVFAPQVRDMPEASMPSVHVAQSIDGWQIVSAIILLIGCGLLIRFVLVLRTVQRLKKSSLPIESALPEEWTVDGRRPAIAESRMVRVPVTVGFWKPLIVLPADWCAWEAWKLRSVLVHEQTHVRRRDWVISVIAAFAKSVFWFNPLLWWLERKLSTLAELASDEACVRDSGNPRRYAETLLEFATAARQGQRWIGGVAMAQHKISLRIERVLTIQKPGLGILSRAAWISVIVVAIPVLYASAATQSGVVEIQQPAAGILEAFQPQIPETVAVAATLPEQQTPVPAGQAPVPPAAPVAPATVIPPVPPEAAAQQPTQVPPGTSPPGQIPPNPDLVGEIRLILAPVDSTVPGQIEIQTRSGTNRFTGRAVWNIRNAAVPPSAWAANNAASWGVRNAFSFALTGVQNRTLQFEGANGSSFSYGCKDCFFFVWEAGVGTPPAIPAGGMEFQLSADGLWITTICRSTTCLVAVTDDMGNVVARTLRGSEMSMLEVGPMARASFAVTR
jgi:beta-lactamase regulating signal transducer with metallopeptidase domain